MKIDTDELAAQIAQRVHVYAYDLMSPAPEDAVLKTQELVRELLVPHILDSKPGQEEAMLLRISQLERARDAALAHLILAPSDVKGAFAALTIQRDAPELFDMCQFEGEEPKHG